MPPPVAAWMYTAYGRAARGDGGPADHVRGRWIGRRDRRGDQAERRDREDQSEEPHCAHPIRVPSAFRVKRVRTVCGFTKGLGPGHARSSTRASTMPGRASVRTASPTSAGALRLDRADAGERAGDRAEGGGADHVLASGDRVRAVVEQQHEQVRRGEPREGPERAGAHRELAVSDDRDDVALGPAVGDPERGREPAAHGAPEVQVRPVVRCEPEGRGRRSERRHEERLGRGGDRSGDGVSCSHADLPAPARG